MKGKDTTYLLNHILAYRLELEKYCDELEEENSKLYCLKDKRYEELTKALDKTCEELGKVDTCPDREEPEECCLGENNECAECWKEWLLKDE